MLDKLKSWSGAILGVVAVGAMGWGWAAGGYQTWAASSAFFRAGGELESLRAELAESQMTQQYVRTVDGNSEILNTSERLVLVISRRLLYRKGDKVVVTGIEQSGAPSIDLTVSGDFLPADRGTIAAVSPDVAARLGISRTKRSVQIKPQK